MANPIVHFEIHADDPDRAQKFYEEVFGWRFTVLGPDMGNYRLIMTGKNPDQGPAVEGINGGMMQRNAEKPAAGLSPMAYVCIVGVDDIDASIENVRAAGGTEHMAKMEVPGVGQLAYFADTEGNVFGMLEPVPRAEA
jgi:predicted enzyme related to lactoylglutathione lyase